VNTDPLAVPNTLPAPAAAPPDLLPVEEIARLSAAILERVATVVVGMTEAVEWRWRASWLGACALRGRARAGQDTRRAQPRLGAGPGFPPAAVHA
jgi:hypothetical protein